MFSGMVSTRYIGFSGSIPGEILPNFESLIRNEIRKKENEDPINRLETLKEELERQLSAEKLLKHILGDEEYKTFINEGEIRVKSKKYSNRIYIIKELGMIEVFENELLIEKLCINPRNPNFPSQDQLVSKKLGLEEAEELILETANHISFSTNERENEGENRGETFWRRIRRR